MLTPLLAKYLSDEEKRQRRLVHIPMGRFGEAEEMVKGALFLASDDSSFMTGQSLLIDGGITAAYVTPGVTAHRRTSAVGSRRPPAPRGSAHAWNAPRSPSRTCTRRSPTGDVDTVLVAFPDLQGRLVGKRVTGRYFVDTVLDGSIEACNYLLAVDVDMTPLPGYRAFNWEQGYGDFSAVPDLATLRLVPWLEKTALVLCDLVDEQDAHADRGVAPPDPAAPRSSGRPSSATR